MLIPEEKVQEILERTDIVGLISRTVELRRAGRSLKGLCPFHGERTPSFTVSPERRRFKCFGCGASGDAIAFLMRQEGKGFSEAARSLAAVSGVRLDDAADDRAARERLELRRVHELATRFYRECLWNPKLGGPARSHLKGRGLDGEAAKRFGLGFAPPSWNEFAARAVSEGMLELALQAGLCSRRTARKPGAPPPNGRDPGCYDFFRGRVMIPIRNAEGVTVAFGGRTLPLAGRPEDDRKFINSRESPIYKKGELLFAIDVAKETIRKSGQALLVEGYFDAIALHRQGLTNAVALCSASLTAEQVKLLRRFEAKEIVLILDGDDAGRRGVARAAGALLATAMPTRVMVLPSGEDPDDHVLRVGAERFRAEVAAALPLTEHLIGVALPQRATASFEAKVKALADLRPILAQVPEGLERSLFLTALAQGLGVSEPELRQGITGGKKASPAALRASEAARTASGSRQGSRSSETVPQGRWLTEELLLVAHLLVDPELARLPQGTEFESLIHLGLRGLACAQVEAILAGKPESSADLLQALPEALRTRLQELMRRVAGQSPKAHREEFVQRCSSHQRHLLQQEEDQLQLQLRQLAKQIAERRSRGADPAEIEGLEAEHLRLAQEKQALTQSRRPSTAVGNLPSATASKTLEHRPLTKP